MTLQQGMRALRILGYGLAVIAAVVVFVMGGRDGGQNWQIPGLVLIGVLVVILHFATQPFMQEPVVTREIVEYTTVGSVAAAGPAPAGSATPMPIGQRLPDVAPNPVVDSVFPDAGRAHAPAYAPTDQTGLPALHEVLPGPTSPTNAPPPTQPVQPTAPAQEVAPQIAHPAAESAELAAVAGVAGSSPDSVLVDLRTGHEEDPMVFRFVEGDPTAAGRHDVSAPAVELTSFEPSALEPSALEFNPVATPSEQTAAPGQGNPEVQHPASPSVVPAPPAAAPQPPPAPPAPPTQPAGSPWAPPAGWEPPPAQQPPHGG